MEKIKLSISNIAWMENQDEEAYSIMRRNGYCGLEIAPTRIFAETPYRYLRESRIWAERMKKEQGLCISSMQSIWYGRQEKLFGSDEERKILLEYTKSAIDFAQIIGCPNLVFGCPKNRSVLHEKDSECAIDFFSELADYADAHKTALALEPNPPIYNTNYINTTKQAIELVQRVDAKGIGVNLDVGAIIENKESLNMLYGKTEMIRHIHISEPGLKKIKRRSIHKELAELLKAEGYCGFVSVEMERQENLSEIDSICAYIREVFQ